MAQTLKKVSGHTNAQRTKDAETQQQLSNKARWTKAAELLKELEKLKFKEAAKAVRKQVASEMKEAAMLQKGGSTKRSTAEDSESEDEFESESYDDSSSNEEDDDSTTVEESSSEEDESSSSSSEEEETESDDEENGVVGDLDHNKPVAQKRPTLTRKAVSFSDDDNDIRFLSPLKGTKETLFYTREEIEKFRLDERIRKTDEASANLSALIADSKLTVGGMS